MGDERQVSIILKLKQQLNAEFGSAAQQLQNQIKAVDSAAKDLNQTQKQTEQSSKGMGASFVDIAAKLYLVEQAVKKVVEVFQFLYETGKHGAEIEQIGVSFEHVIEAAGGTTAVLDQLRQVTKGTVADSQLMIAVNQSLVGTTGAYKEEMLKALPALTEMARASAMLNPQFGDTTQQLDRLTLGLKRMEPRILDDIGLELRLTEVNKNYAAQIGKSVNELTSEEKQIALLNAVLERQAEYVGLAGKNAESAVDPYTRMEAAAKNLFDTMSKNANTGMAPTVEAIATWLDGVNNYFSAVDKILAANTTHQEEIRKTSKTYEEYIAESNRANTVTSDGATAVMLMTGRFQDYDKVQKNVTETNKSLTEEQYNVLNGIDQVTDAWDRNSYAVLANSTAEHELSDEQQKLLDQRLGKMQDYFIQEIRLKQKGIDAQRDYDDRIEELNEDHQKRLTDIQTDAANARILAKAYEEREKAQIEEDYAKRKADLEKDLSELQMELEGKNPYVDEATTQAITDQEALLKATKSNLETLKRDAKNGHAGPSMDAEIQATEDLIRQTEDSIAQLKDSAREQERRKRLEERIKEKQDQIKEAAEQKDRDLKAAEDKAAADIARAQETERKKTLNLNEEYDKRKGKIKDSFDEIKQAAEQDLQIATTDAILSMAEAESEVAKEALRTKFSLLGATDEMINKYLQLRESITGPAGVLPALMQLNAVAAMNPTGSMWSYYSNYGGGRASGGNVSAGHSYLVGENGPEILQMGGGNGTIIPNGGGGGVTVIVQAGAFLGNRSDAVAFGNMVGPIVADWQSRYGGATNAAGTRNIRSAR